MQTAWGIAVMVAALLGVAQAWGPLSHYYFARQAFPNADPDTVKLGCDMPDGFYFANWAQHPECVVNVDDMHNGVFPGYLVQFALTPEAARFKRDGFDPLSMALAFGSHVYADVVGFFSPYGGYLGPSVPNYATTWPLMTAIDALVSLRIPFDLNSKVKCNAGFCSTLMSYLSCLDSQIAAEFVAAGTEYSHSINSKYNVYNASAIKKCSDNWGTAGIGLIKVAKLQAESVYYQKALIAYDQFNATTFAQTSRNFDLANACAVQAIQHWASLVQGQRMRPEDAFVQTYTFVRGLFAKGSCTPVPVV